MDSQKQSLLARLKRQSQWIFAIEQDLINQDKRFFWYRLISFSAAWVGAILTRLFLPGSTWLIVFIFFMFVYFIVVLFHRKLDAVRLRYQNTRHYLENQIARLTLDWSQLPPYIGNDIHLDHPFAADLNLSGPKSLLQLLNVTQTSGGEKRLQDWVINSELDSSRLHQRQNLVAEISGLPGFRRHYLTSRSNQRWDDRSLMRWLKNGSPNRSFNFWLIALSCLAVINLTLLVLALLTVIKPFWQFGLILYAAIYLFKYQEYKDLFSEAFSLNETLSSIKDTLTLLEQYPYPRQGKLKNITSILSRTESKPSKILQRVTWITSAASLQNNQILWLLINLLVPWDLWFAKVLNKLKVKLNSLLPTWLEIWYEIDALVSLSNFAYLNPEYHFPQILSPRESNDPVFQAENLGHPLIDSQSKVTNSFSIDHLGEIVLITGSNMSGKSTFLRTLGINLALAYAGAPVNASQMKLAILRLFSCIQVSDSLADGFSYFYAEVRRLKMLLDLLERNEEIPVFYLIDEIFRGTNNQERRIGSQSYVRSLAKARSSGMISTHDLELAKLADENRNILNFHFRDDVRDGKMYFDYQLRPGPSPSTNALKIMRNEGLPVDTNP